MTKTLLKYYRNLPFFKGKSKLGRLLFKNIILSKDIDIIPLLRKFIKKTDSKLNFEEHNAEDDKELIYKVYNPDDYALLNVEKNN